MQKLHLLVAGFLSGNFFSCATSEKNSTTTVPTTTTTTTTTTTEPITAITLIPEPISDDDGPSPTLGPAEVPDWITPAELRSALIHGLNLRIAIPQASDASLAETPAEPFSDVFTPINPSASFVSDGKYMGVQDSSINVDNFSIAWNFFGANACSKFLSIFYITRPVWYIASYQELSFLRECISIAKDRIDRVDTQSSDEFRFGLIIASAVKDWLPVAFSSKSELAIRAKRSIITKSTEFPSFAAYIDSKPRIKQLLETAPGSDIPGLTGTDKLWLETMKDGLEVHVADFVDYHWSAAALSMRADTTLPAWKLLYAAQNQRAVFDFDAEKVFVNDNIDTALNLQMTLYRFGMGAARNAWLITVGNLIGKLWNNSPDALNACVPVDSQITSPADIAQLFYALDEDINKLLPLYRCLTDGIDAGQLIVADDDIASIATVMHLVRMITSPIAFVKSQR